VVLVIAMGIGLFAPPLGLGLYGACLIGNVPIEQTVKPILAYLGCYFCACWWWPSSQASVHTCRALSDIELTCESC
jgi:TRAP-type C4-dicarboxylate transport system permease large subunit